VKVAAVTDPSGRTVGWWAVAGAAALLAVTLAPLWLSSRDATYGVCAAGLGAALLGYAVVFARSPTDSATRRLLWASLIYLPAMLAVLVVC
jgi:protoheme IX farnesyltransferase